MAYEPSGLVVGKFAPFHNGHKLVIDTALEQMDWVYVLVYSNPDFPDMPAHARAEWIRQEYRGKWLSVHIPENPPPDDADDFTQREFVRVWLEENVQTTRGIGKVDCVFGSDAYIPGFAAHIGASPVMVDQARNTYPSSGTGVRALTRRLSQGAKLSAFGEDVWCEFDPALFVELQSLVPESTFAGLQFWMRPVKTAVLLGAESTGKSTLSERLALEYGTAFAPEYGREVWEAKNGELELADYVRIAHRHRELEIQAALEAQARGGRWLFVDTNAITTMFLGYAYEGDGLRELTALARAAERRYHHVFLCADDIPFVQDGWRDDSVWRSRAQGMVRYDLAVRGVKYTMVSGSLEDRVQQVRAVLDARLEIATI